jgi:hypothetical protein
LPVPPDPPVSVLLRRVNMPFPARLNRTTALAFGSFVATKTNPAATCGSARKRGGLAMQKATTVMSAKKIGF